MRNSLGLLVLLVYLLFMAGLIFLEGPLLVLAIPPLVYLAAAVLWLPSPLRLEAERNLDPERMVPGEPVSVIVVLQNAGARLDEILVEDLLPEGLQVVEGEASWLGALPAGGTVELRYRVTGTRGQYAFQSLQVRTVDPFGLIPSTRHIPAPGRILGLPPVPAVRYIPIHPRNTRAYTGIIPARQGGEGIEFFGVRDYQPGDSLRHINWRASARYLPRFHERLLVNEFELERAVEVALILDARSRSNVMTAEGSLFEFEVSAASGLAETLLRDGNRVSLLVYGQYLDRTYPGYGKLQRERILRALSQANVGDSQVFEKLENLPTRLLPPRSQLILLSSLLPDDVDLLTGMRARGHQLLVISPDPISYQLRMLPKSPDLDLAVRAARLERSLIFGRLRHAGVHVVDWNVDVPFDQIMKTRMIRGRAWVD